MNALRADLLDCVQANLAVLADRWHGPDTYLRLGARLELRTRPGADGLLTVEPTVHDHLAAARASVGVDGTALSYQDGATLAATVDNDPRYVVADAYHLPWVPYHRQRHLEHSFLLERVGSGFTVTDAYHNDTPWGVARPGQWTVTSLELAAALPDGVIVVRPTPAARTPAPAPRLGADVKDAATVSDYLAGYDAYADRAAALEALTLQTWLLARSRKLHAAYRMAYRENSEINPDIDIDAVAAHLAGWDRVVEQTYLAARRVQRGRTEPPGLLAGIADLLAADQKVFGTRRTDSDLRTTVADVVRAVLQLDRQPSETAELSTYPTFSSFRMVEIVDRLEQQLKIEFRADDLIPERLHRIEDLCELVRRARPDVALATAGGSQ